MKKIILLFCICMLSSTTSFSQNIPQEHTKVVNTLLSSVMEHNSKGILKALDKAYKKEQLAFLKGNKEQFLNELFGGEDLETGDYQNPKLNDITSIEIINVIKLKEGGYTYIFKVSTVSYSIYSTLYLSVDKKLGFIGAIG